MPTVLGEHAHAECSQGEHEHARRERRGAAPACRRGRPPRWSAAPRHSRRRRCPGCPATRARLRRRPGPRLLAQLLRGLLRLRTRDQHVLSAASFLVLIVDDALCPPSITAHRVKTWTFPERICMRQSVTGDEHGGAGFRSIQNVSDAVWDIPGRVKAGCTRGNTKPYLGAVLSLIQELGQLGSFFGDRLAERCPPYICAALVPPSTISRSHRSLSRRYVPSGCSMEPRQQSLLRHAQVSCWLLIVSTAAFPERRYSHPVWIKGNDCRASVSKAVGLWTSEGLLLPKAVSACYWSSLAKHQENPVYISLRVQWNMQ